MIPLRLKTNVNAPGGAWPYGELRDNPGDNSGTPVNEELVSDVMQLMEFLMVATGTTPNGLLDNAANNFQLAEALQAFIRDQQADETIKGTAELATQAETNTGTDDLRIITPLKLSGRTATETRTGIAEIATEAEFRAATDALRIVTPDKFGAWFLSVPTLSSSSFIASTSTVSFRWKIIGKTVHCRFFYNALTTGTGDIVLVWDMASISTPIAGLAPQCTASIQVVESGSYLSGGYSCTIGNGSDYGKMVHRIPDLVGVLTIQVTGTITFEIA